MTGENINSFNTQTRVQENEEAVPCFALQKALAFRLTSLWDFLECGSSMKAHIPVPLLLKYYKNNLDLEGKGRREPLDYLV